MKYVETVVFWGLAGLIGVGAQPVITAFPNEPDQAFLGYYYNYDTTEYNITVGPNETYDFSGYGESVPVNESDIKTSEIPADSLVLLSLSDAEDPLIDLLNLPDSSGKIYPYRGVSAFITGNEVEYVVIFLKEEPSGLFLVGDGALNQDGTQRAELFDDKEFFVPFGLNYGEQIDTTYGYSYPPGESPYSYDSLRSETTWEYVGYGKLNTWFGSYDDVAVLLRKETRKTSYFNQTTQEWLPASNPLMYESLLFFSPNYRWPLFGIDGEYSSSTSSFTVAKGANETFFRPFDAPTSLLITSKRDNVELSAFPNPTSSVVNIYVPNNYKSSVDVRIYTITGVLKEVHKNISILQGDDKVRLKADHLPSGTYFVIVSHPEGTARSQLIVVRH